MSTKDNRHTKQDDRDEVKQYKERRNKYIEEEPPFEDDEVSDEVADWLHRHMK